MRVGQRPLLLLMMVLGLTAASLVAIVLKPATLGLDLQGGVEVVLEGRQVSADAPVNQSSIDRSVEVIRKRVDAFGVAEPEIQTAGDNQIVVSLPGATDPQRVVQDLIRPAQLYFYDLTQVLVDEQPTNTLYKAVQLATNTTPKFPNKGAASLYAFTRAGNEPVGQPVLVTRETGETAAAALQRARADLQAQVVAAGRTMAQVKVEQVPKGLTVVRESRRLATRESGAFNYFVFQDDPALSGRDISSAASIRDVGQNASGEPIVTMDFTSAGGEKFHDITRELAQRGALENRLFSFAIVLDGEMISAPTIDPKDLPDGISGGAARIEGNFTADSARTLAQQINSGAIPILLEPVSQKQVGATLGRESLRQGLIAGVVGLVLVVAFLLLYYRLLGVVATFALLIYAALFYAVILMVPITLTLPGIAGVILTIGISSDANVVIFERVREEARLGKSASAAIAAGYRKGLAAIIDANVVTFFTAVIVFMFATAGPRGFAFTLGIGVLLSLLTAVVATRAIFGVLLGTKFMRDDRALALKQGRVFNIDWVGKWRLWLVLSTIPVAFGLVWMGVNGLSLGLDFNSGTRISATFDRPATEGGIRDIYAAEGINNAKIQSTTQTINGRSVSGFQMQSEPLTPEQQTNIERALNRAYGLTDTPAVDTVGPTFGKQIIRNAITAVILSFIVVALYLIARFEYKLALPAMLSVVHDVLLSVGIYAVTGREITSATVAALLTILGYSLYDVVIVFDRIRENVPLMRGKRYRDIVNASANEVLTRSLITSLTTLLPVLALFFFGGETLRDFAFALAVGILSGGVSSIIIAAPIAAWWKERDPDERKRAAKAERRRQRMIASDADVVDLSVLERAESGLAEMPLEHSPGLLGDGSEGSMMTATPEPEGTILDDIADENDAEADYEPLDGGPASGATATGETDGGPEDTASADAGDGADRPAAKRPDRDRQRRHTRVRRRRR